MGGLLVGPGTDDTMLRYESRGSCIRACQQKDEMYKRVECENHACMCFECFDSPMETCRRCYGVKHPLGNCGDKSKSGENCFYMDPSVTQLAPWCQVNQHDIDKWGKVTDMSQ